MALAIDVAAESERLDSKKPYVELINGIEVPKVNPQLRHAQLQTKLAVLVSLWAETQEGVVVTEARFWLDVNPKTATSLLPDVAFVTAERLRDLSATDQQQPPFAPDLAIEIRSPSDRDRNVALKIERYLERGARLVLDVDPQKRVIVAHDGVASRVFGSGEIVEHSAMMGLRLDVDAVMKAGDPPR
ncbi:MAG: Uma2 family endonuclease [Vulcanimicrobiaceae bacterium]